jgi:hypothetical protein
MGTSFFKGDTQKAPQISGGSQSMEARAIGSAAYAGKGASVGAQKDIGAALGINKAGYKGPMRGTAAYAPGPKKT